MLNEELAEQEGLIAKALRAGAGLRIGGEEVDQLVAEDGGAAGLEEDEGEAGVDLRREVVEDLFEVGASLFEEAKIVEGPAATDVVARDFGREARGLEDLNRGGEGLRTVVVIPRIRPQEHLRCGDWPSRRTRFAPFMRMVFPI